MGIIEIETAVKSVWTNKDKTETIRGLRRYSNKDKIETIRELRRYSWGVPMLPEWERGEMLRKRKSKASQRRREA